MADPCGGRHHLHKHDAHFALERDRGFVRERESGPCPRERRSIYTVHTGAAARTLRSSNAEFDASLRARNAAWGVRDLDDVAACAREKGFGEPQIVEMPANNLSVIFRR